MSRHAYLSELPMPLRLPLRPGASPGLLRRRYSVPETVMRKYRLAQQQSDSDYSNAYTHRTMTSAAPSSASCGTCSGMCVVGRGARRDREMVRRSALLRRLWGRTPPCCFGPCDSPTSCVRETRSLDGSTSDLNHFSSSFTSSRQSQPVANWSPKRHRLELPQDYQRNSEIFKTFGKNNIWDKTEEIKCGIQNLVSSGSAEHKMSASETIKNDSYKNPKCENMYDQNTSIKNSERSTHSEMELPTLAKNDGVSERHNLEVAIETNNISSSDTLNLLSLSDSTTKEIHFSNDSKSTYQFSDTDLMKQIMRKNVVDNGEVNSIHFNSTMSNPTYEVLEVIVAETIDPNSLPAISDRNFVKTLNTVANNSLCKENSPNINIDEYVSNILVESLNSLTDQLESMNATICSDRKISIVEKEIKVRLQNTGVNTVVHLSPMSNNQIIFGNEELYHLDEDKNNSDNPNNENLTIREDISAESNNNATSVDICNLPIQYDENTNEIFNDLSQKSSVNSAVLQQIQKLFKDELQSLEPEISHLDNTNCSKSHTELSNANLHLNQNLNTYLDKIEYVDPQTNMENTELISGVGTGNYFPDLQDNATIPRFTAYPHTDSMEVNTSSDDTDLIASECTSLVDSLDDPNSPRSMILKRSLNNNKRNELVRSAIDVLDLLPESALKDNSYNTKEKGESFFIRIKDDDCDCEKENIVVADHMPEKIKQMLYRRHKKRELRMEIVRRNKVNHLKSVINKQRVKDMHRMKKEVEKDCALIIDDLIAETIAKIVQDEYKYMRIKQKPSKTINSNSTENIYTRTNRTAAIDIDKNLLQSHICYSFNQDRSYDNLQVPGETCSLVTRRSATSNKHNNDSKRIYQKSEIHEGDKCVEILEILECVDTSHSSTETNTSEDGPVHNHKNRQSRIPVPVYDKQQKHPNKNDSIRKNSSNMGIEKDEKSSQLIANMLLSAFCEDDNVSSLALHNHKLNGPEPLARRASVPYQEPRPRAHSMKFKRVFEIIPEEKSSLSLESSNEDINYTRRVSAPNLADSSFSNKKMKDTEDRINKERREKGFLKTKLMKHSSSSKETRNAGTSPIVEGDLNKCKQNYKIVNKTTMTSPTRKSAATSPMTSVGTEAESAAKESIGNERNKRTSLISLREGLKEQSNDRKLHNDPTKMKQSATTEYSRPFNAQSTVRTIQGEKSNPIIVGREKNRRQGRRRSYEHEYPEAEILPSHGESRDKKTESKECRLAQRNVKRNDLLRDKDNSDYVIRKIDKQKIRMVSVEKSEEETFHESVGLAELKKTSNEEERGSRETSGSDDDSESEGSLLRSLAPRWLAAPRRRTRAVPCTFPVPRDSPSKRLLPANHHTDGWSVTVAGSRGAPPADLEMRLRFPTAEPPAHATRPPRHFSRSHTKESGSTYCGRCESMSPTPIAPPESDCPPLLPAPSSAHLPLRNSRRVTLTMQKEALDSSILASKSRKKSTDALPNVESYQASKSKSKSSMKRERWRRSSSRSPRSHPQRTPSTEPAAPPLLNERGLSVLGAAIVPELKPRAPSMSERDLTRTRRRRLPPRVSRPQQPLHVA